MNKKLIAAFILLSVVFVTCVEEHVLPNFGHVFITSDPVGAEIYKDGEATGEVTPAQFDELLSGTYIFSLTLPGFIDTTFSFQVNENQELSEDIFLIEENPQGRIILNSEPPGALIYAKGLSTGNVTPDTLYNLQRGDYNYTLKLDLYEDHNVNISLDKDEAVTRNIQMVIAGTAGKIYITSNPAGATIVLDGEQTSLVTPDTLSPLSPGQHSILLSLENYRDTTIVSNVVSGDVTNEDVELTFYEPRGSITLDSNPQSAQIFLNGNDTEFITPRRRWLSGCSTRTKICST